MRTLKKKIFVEILRYDHEKGLNTPLMTFAIMVKLQPPIWHHQYADNLFCIQIKLRMLLDGHIPLKL